MTKRPSVLALAWGVGWGIALGSWILAPRLLVFCNVNPSSAAGWVALSLVLAGVFAVLGALLGFVACVPLVLVEATRGRFREPALAYGVAVPILAPIVYFALALAIEVVTTGPLRRTDFPPHVEPRAIALLVAAAVVATLAYFGRLSTRRLRAIVALTAIVGLVLLPSHAPPLPPLIRGSTVTLQRKPAGHSTRAPLLFVGIDSGDWRTLAPLLERGALPTLEQLRSSGLHGRVRALWPPYWSAPAWAAIVTGFARDETGVYQDLTLEVPGLFPFEVPLHFDFLLEPVIVAAVLLAQGGVTNLVPHRREMLHRAPVWELAAAAGVKTAVVRFPFTFPPNGSADYVVSDRVGAELWRWLGMREEKGVTAVWPHGEAPNLRAPFAEPLRAAELAPLLDSSKRRPASSRSVDPLVVLESAARLDEQTAKVAVDLVSRHSEVGLAAVYLGGFDLVCHAFWHYRFPEDFAEEPPAPEDVAALGGVIDRYWTFLDRSLADVIAAFPERPNVVIVADHGAERSRDNYLWRGWHSADGAIFIAAGPDVPRLEEEIRVSYFDITPTVLDLAGFEKPAELSGTSLLDRALAKSTASGSS